MKMTKTRVGVVRGGISNEYDISLKTGGAVLRSLPPHLEPLDILIDKGGTWHCNGLPNEPQRILSHLDVVFNALHGYYGEDGKVQRLLDSFGVCYTGSGALPSALGMNKALAKDIFKETSLKTPYYTVLKNNENILKEIVRIYREFPQPSVVKPLNCGSSLGVFIARDFSGFSSAVLAALEYSSGVLIEEYIDGREAACGVLDNFRNERHYALPPIEIIPPGDREFFDYEAKYSGATQEICPSHFSPTEKEEMMRVAVRAHRALGLRHYSRADFIVSPRGVYILEVNTLPGLTEESLLPKAAQAVGCSFPNFLDHVINLALERK